MGVFTRFRHRINSILGHPRRRRISVSEAKRKQNNEFYRIIYINMCTCIYHTFYYSALGGPCCSARIVRTLHNRKFAPVRHTRACTSAHTYVIRGNRRRRVVLSYTNCVVATSRRAVCDRLNYRNDRITLSCHASNTPSGSHGLRPESP